MKVLILAGGGGTRLFPLSRSCFPKQFLNAESDQSLLAQTIKRFLPMTKAANIVVVTNQSYHHLVKAELAECGASDAHIILEPVGRNTAPAIALAVRYCMDELGADDNEAIFVTPSDHIVRPSKDFVSSVQKAMTEVYKNKIVTFGISPDKPEVGYGYIQAGEPYGSGYKVTSFTEKPNIETAEKYLVSGNYYWNSGMFGFTIGCLMQEIQDYQPDIYNLTINPFSEMLERFAEMPDISFDYAVAEKSARVVTIPLTAYWNDIGSWDAIYEVLDKDGDGNAVRGDCIPIECSSSLMLGRSRLIAGIGLKDILVVETDDVILVAQKGESQKVKELVKELRSRGRREVDENTTMFRPWGSYTILSEGPGYKIKKLAVITGQRLSLQLHYHRSEHWVVIGGTAKVTIGEKVQMVHKNESVFIPPSTMHRLENPGRIMLEIIEVQNGEYLEEDDIVRFDDEYGRG